MSEPQVLTKEAAEVIAGLSVETITALLKVASLGQKAEGIKSMATRVAEGKGAGFSFAPAAPHPVTIQAYSFVKDKGQYSATYGLSSVQAAELADKLETNPDAAVSEIAAIVRERLAKRGSPKPVSVTLEGMPGSVSAPGGQSGGDGGARMLAAEIARNSSFYGCFQFVAESTGRVGPQAFSVALGGDLYALGQSRKVAIAAARLCRGKGRKDDTVKPYIYYWVGGKTPRFVDDIPADAFSGQLDAGAPSPPNRTATAATIAG